MTQEVLKLALEALYPIAHNTTDDPRGQAYKAITAIKEALAQPEQEPVAWRNAAIHVGENLCSVGPFGYYDMTADQWLTWALSVVTVHSFPPQRTEQEPVAWRTFDGEGGYDYRSYEDNESYADDWNKRNPNHAGWVDKLYTHSQPEQKPVVCCQQYDTCLQPCTPRGEHLVRRKWVGLTDEEIDAIYTGVRAVHHEINSDLFARAIESKLKEVNT